MHLIRVFPMDSDISDESMEQAVPTNKPRKRNWSVETWKRNKQKEERYNQHASKKAKIDCNHDTAFCVALKLTDEHISNVNLQYWKNKDAVSQRNFILSLIDVKTPERQRPNQGNKEGSCKNKTIIYYIPTAERNVPVCRKTFLSILNVGRRKVENAAEEKRRHGSAVPETRGGMRLSTKLQGLCEEIQAHIQSFQCREQHWGCGKTPLKKYLPSTLNVGQMWSMFCKQKATAASEGSPYCTYALYYKVFVTKFNLGFGSVKQDTCYHCHAFSVCLKAVTEDEQKKCIVVEKLVHKHRVKAFFQHLNEFPPDSVTINFDLMQNQPLPKTQISQAYYSRQLWYYTLGIIFHREDKTISPETTHYYRWLESEGGRGPSEISSCLWHFFNTYLKPYCDAKKIKYIRVFCDSCAPQNKNYCLLFMFCVIASQYSFKIEWFFSVCGHSYMPADRSFGIVEKRLRKIKTILFPEKYDAVFKSVGTVHILGSDFKWMNWQEVAQYSVPATKRFNISEAKRLTIQAATGLVGLYATYGVKPVCQHNMIRQGLKYDLVVGNIKEMQRKSHVQEAKKKDVTALLATMGYKDVNQLPFYKYIVEGNTDAQESDDENASLFSMTE